MSNAALEGLRNTVSPTTMSLKRQVGYEGTASDMSDHLKRLKMGEEEDMDEDL